MKDFSLECCLLQGSNGKAKTFKAENFRDMKFCGYSFLHKNDVYVTMTVVFVHTKVFVSACNQSSYEG